MLKLRKSYNNLLKNYHISKFQKKSKITLNNFQQSEIFLSLAGQNELFLKDLAVYAVLLFGQKPKFYFKKQSKQNTLNQLVYFKISISQKKILTNLQKISNLILPHQENYLITAFPSILQNTKNLSFFFQNCLTGEEIQFTPKTNLVKILNSFNLTLNFNTIKTSRPELQFFFRFYHFPFN